MILTMDAGQGHDELVDALLAAGAIRSPAVEAAFREVPRHLFVPNVPLAHAYRDEAITTKVVDGRPVSSASQPSVVATMLEQLGVERGQRVLEIGAGTGYNAALLGRLVGPSGRVVTVDIDEEIVASARTNLSAAGVDNVEVLCRDGGQGYPDAAPYDRVVLTVGAWDIAPEWCEQLAPSGRLLVPLALRGIQRCIAFEKRDGWMESVSVRNCGFMRLRGAFRGPETVVTAGPVTITFDAEVDAAVLPSLLAQHRAAERSVDLSIGVDEVFDGLALWLALHEPGYCTVDAVWHRDVAPPVPVAAAVPSGDVMLGWSPATFDGSSLAVLTRSDRTISAHAFGAHGRTAERLVDAAVQWHAAGRPGSDGLTVQARPCSGPVDPEAGLLTVAKRWTTLRLGWRGGAT